MPLNLFECKQELCSMFSSITERTREWHNARW